MKRAYIIGNGVSRKAIDLERLKNTGTTFGCNALYRDFSPHYLVVIDRKMQNEVFAAKYHENNKVLVRSTGKDSYIPESKNIYKFKNRISSPNNSGMAAIYFAMRAGYRDIFLIGFDFESPSGHQQFNVYANTPCYDRHGTRPPKVPRNIPVTLGKWAVQNDGVVQFTRVYDEKYTNLYEDMKGFDLIKHISIGEFNELY